MASARNEAPKFSKLDKLNTSNFVQWREDIVSEVMLHNLDHYLPGSKKILCQYWFDNYLLTNYWDLGFQYQVNIEPISR